MYLSSKKVKTDTIFVVKKSVLPLFGGVKSHEGSTHRWMRR